MIRFHIQQVLILAKSYLDTSPLPNSSQSGDVAASSLSTVLKIVFGVAGSVALLMIVISGFRYVVAAGDPAKMAQAKQAILYAVIGLVVALAAFSIVTFVVRGVG